MPKLPGTDSDDIFKRIAMFQKLTVPNIAKSKPKLATPIVFDPFTDAQVPSDTGLDSSSSTHWKPTPSTRFLGTSGIVAQISSGSVNVTVNKKVGVVAFGYSYRVNSKNQPYSPPYQDISTANTLTLQCSNPASISACTLTISDGTNSLQLAPDNGITPTLTWTLAFFSIIDLTKVTNIVFTFQTSTVSSNFTLKNLTSVIPIETVLSDPFIDPQFLNVTSGTGVSLLQSTASTSWLPKPSIRAMLIQGNALANIGNGFLTLQIRTANSLFLLEYLFQGTAQDFSKVAGISIFASNMPIFSTSDPNIAPIPVIRLTNTAGQSLSILPTQPINTSVPRGNTLTYLFATGLANNPSFDLTSITFIDFIVRPNVGTVNFSNLTSISLKDFYKVYDPFVDDQAGSTYLMSISSGEYPVTIISPASSYVAPRPVTHWLPPPLSQFRTTQVIPLHQGSTRALRTSDDDLVTTIINNGSWTISISGTSTTTDPISGSAFSVDLRYEYSFDAYNAVYIPFFQNFSVLSTINIDSTNPTFRQKILLTLSTINLSTNIRTEQTRSGDIITQSTVVWLVPRFSSVDLTQISSMAFSLTASPTHLPYGSFTNLRST